MGKFYLEHELPEHIVTIAEYLYKQFDEYVLMTIPFSQNYGNKKLAFTVKQKSKTFPFAGRPLNSLANLNFGTLSYENSRVINEGDFTISSELLNWYEYKNSSDFKKLYIRTKERIQENEIPISIFLAIIAIIISVFF